MKKYTVIADYGATGEGRIISLWMGFAQDEAEARSRFESSVHGGDFYAIGASVIEGFSFKNRLVRLFLTKAMRDQLNDDNCYRSFSGLLHFNYS
jgi:hypothetical protein